MMWILLLEMNAGSHV